GDDGFRREWKFGDAYTDGVPDGVGDGGRDREDPGFADALGAERPGPVRALHDERSQLVRQILRRRQLVVEQRAVGELPLVDDQLIEQRVADTHDRCAGELLLDQPGIDRLTDVPG